MYLLFRAPGRTPDFQGQGMFNIVLCCRYHSDNPPVLSYSLSKLSSFPCGTNSSVSTEIIDSSVLISSVFANIQCNIMLL